MMNDYIEASVKNIDMHILAQVKTLTAARGTMSNAAGLNDLLEAKKNLLSMKGSVKSAPVVDSGLIKCEHCGEENTKAMHGRWHGDKCKSKK